MKLFEITTGAVGESYVRAYAWAETEEQARNLAIERLRGSRHEIASVTELFDSASKPFCTSFSDSGWE